MITHPTTDRDRTGRAVEAKVSTISFGPCWCRAVPGSDGSFDVMRQRTVKAPFGRDVLAVSDRVPPSGVPMVRRQLEVLSNPIIVATRSCPSARWYWDAAPAGWVEVDELVGVDHRVDGCLTGQPEIFFASLLDIERTVSGRSHLSAVTEVI